MNLLLSRFAFLLTAAATLVAGSAWAQLTVTDGVTTKTTCTGYGLSSSGGATTITLTPNNCLTGTTSGTEPVFSVRVAPASTAQPTTAATGVQTVQVFVDADRDVPTTTTYSLTLNLCTAAQNCTSAGSGNWYFFRNSELGGAGSTPQDAVTTGSFTFTFQPGANTSPANLRSMGVGRMDVPNSPLFSGTRSVMFSLSGTQAQTNVVAHTITGGLQLTGDLDINGTPIPNIPLSTTAYWQCELLGQPGSPGPNSNNPCGAYEIPVGDCSSGMTGANAVTKAYLLQLEDYYPGSLRIGNTLRMGFARHAAMVFKFKTGLASTFTLPRNFGVGYDDQTNRGPGGPRFVTVSEKKCDFDYAKLYTGDLVTGKSGCFKSDIAGAVSGFVTATGTENPFPYCRLKPDTMYYLNLRYENAGVPSQRGLISCPTDGNAYQACGSAVQFQ